MKNLLFAFILFPLVTFAIEYSSQVGQDRYVNEHYFHSKREGVFIDVGAYDGKTGSNSYFFEKHLGWKGICVEPVPAFFNRLKTCRDCIAINACIGESGIKDFLWIDGQDEQLSGLLETYDPRHKEVIDRVAVPYGDRHEIIKVNSIPLMDVLAQHHLTHVDYLSVDTEGGELDILKAINFDKVTIDIIDVENQYSDPAFATYLATKGYTLVAHLVIDDIYVRNGAFNS